jgi:hypothetical protein
LLLKKGKGIVDNDIETIKTFFIKNLAPFYEAFNPVVSGLKKR